MFYRGGPGGFIVRFPSTQLHPQRQIISKYWNGKFQFVATWTGELFFLPSSEKTSTVERILKGAAPCVLITTATNSNDCFGRTSDLSYKRKHNISILSSGGRQWGPLYLGPTRVSRHTLSLWNMSFVSWLVTATIVLATKLTLCLPMRLYPC